MAWSSKTQPTPANIRKRITAAIEAVDGALILAAKRDDMDKAQKALNSTRLWLLDAERKARMR